MVFSSAHFLFIFLPLTLSFYFLFRKYKWKNLTLLIASFIFYFWAEPVDIIFLLVSLVGNWLLGRYIDSLNQSQDDSKAKPFLVLGLGFNLLFLLLFKYLRAYILPFLPEAVFTRVDNHNLLLPLGISFFTFSGISYLLDIYEQTAPFHRNFLNFANYILMFPKLLQGPIVQYSQIEDELSERAVSLADVAEGSRRFIIGLTKKVLIADYLNTVSVSAFSATSSIGADLAWFGLIAYSLQIYFDFSGYSDMAIGLGRVLGFHFPENFNSPYTSRSLTEFWRRWHMTLTGWLRTYVFIPLEFARRREKFFRQQSNLLIIFLLTGLWHGVSLNFIIWGLYNGGVLVLESGRLGKWLKRIPVPFQFAYTLFLIAFGWALFRFEDVKQWGPFFKALFGGNGITTNVTLISLDILKFTPIILLGILVCMFTPLSLLKKARKDLWPGLASDLLLVGLFCLSVAVVISRSFQAFIYFRF